MERKVLEQPITPTLHYSITPVFSVRLTRTEDSPSLARMRAITISSFFGLGELGADTRRALSMVYATSVALVMGVNFIQPALPAMTQPLGINDAALGLVMTVFTAPAIFLAPIFGVV